MAFTVEQADWREHADAIRTVRRAVFVQEQGIPAKLEWDGRDPHATTCLRSMRPESPSVPAACSRTATSAAWPVLAPWRGRGVGRALLSHLIQLAAEQGLPAVW